MFRAVPTPRGHVILGQGSKFPTSKISKLEMLQAWAGGSISLSIFLKVWRPLSGEYKRTMMPQWPQQSSSLYIKKLWYRGRRSQFLFHLRHFHRPFKGSYCNWDKYLEISSHKHKLKQILKYEEREVNSQWTMQDLLSVTCSSTRTLPYWADQTDSSICLSKHFS